MFKTILPACVALLCVCLLGCDPSANKRTHITEFEGIVTYSVFYTTYHNDYNNDSTNCFDTMKCYYAHGKSVKIQSGNNPGNIKKVIYLPQEGKQFLSHYDTDSLQWFDVTEHTNIGNKQLTLSKTEEQILKHSCEKFSVKTNFSINGTKSIPKYYYYTISEYLFSKGYLSINKEHFTNCNYIGYNDYTAQSGSLFLSHQYSVYSIQNDKLIYRIYFKALSVKEQKLDPKIFEISTSKLKKIPQPF